MKRTPRTSRDQLQELLSRIVPRTFCSLSASKQRNLQNRKRKLLQTCRSSVKRCLARASRWKDASHTYIRLPWVPYTNNADVIMSCGLYRLSYEQLILWERDSWTDTGSSPVSVIDHLWLSAELANGSSCPALQHMLVDKYIQILVIHVLIFEPLDGSPPTAPSWCRH